MDIWIEDTIENRNNLRAAFKAAAEIILCCPDVVLFQDGQTLFNNGFETWIFYKYESLEGFTFDNAFDPYYWWILTGLKYLLLH